MKPRPESVRVRNEVRPGDLGYVIYMHGALYAREHGYGIQFERYVASGVHEFYERYDPGRDRAWILEHDSGIVGSLFLMHRENNTAQLRYFLLSPEYRGVGLGKRLMQLCMDFAGQVYGSVYLWTTDELETAAALYKRHGFVLTEDKPSASFGKPLREHRYDVILSPA
ncbi:MAG: GNAT family N-acetyltransferase [Arenicellales bacterium]